MEHSASPALLRRIILVAGIVYGAWYAAVAWLLPDAFNPWGSRALVVALCGLAWAASLRSRRLTKRLESLLALCVGLITAHYYYLFYNNRADIDWVVGCYIAVICGSGLIFLARDLLLYSIFVLALSIGLHATNEPLEGGTFLAGIATILLVANLVQRVHARLMRRLHDSEEARVRFEATQRALKMREEYIGILAHELKTPLTALKLRTQSAQRSLQSLNNPKLDAFLLTHERLADRLSRLVNDMLDTSRISAGKLALRREEVDFSALVRECVRAHQETQTGAGPITTNIDDNVRIQIDGFRIEQVLQNLLMNTVKYARGKPVTVSLHEQGQEVVLSVQDLGIGIALEDQARIFERFERAVPARDTSGLGLGLFISEAIVQAHGGRITVQSVLGEGSEFIVRLPRQTGVAGGASDDDVTIASGGGQAKNQSGNGLDG